MKLRDVCWTGKMIGPIIMLIIISLPIMADETVMIQTITENPLNICGPYETISTVTAKASISQGLITYAVAEIMVPDESYLSINNGNEIEFTDVNDNEITATWEVQCDADHPGTYSSFLNFYVNYTIDQNDYYTMENELYQIIVHEEEDFVPPQITSKGPAGVVNDGSLTLYVVTDEYSYCRYSLTDKSYSTMEESFDSVDDEGATHEKTINVEEGEHIYFVKCSDQMGNIMSSSELISFVVDSSPPKITSSSPKGIVSDQVSVTIQTNEEAECRFSEEDVDYSAMENILLTDDMLTHSRNLLISTDGAYNYYVRCMDNIGNINTDPYLISFEVDTPPSARVSLNEQSPIKSGIVEVTLVSSEDIFSPNLKYVLNDGPQRSIPLEGSGKIWEGYMIIDETDEKKVGSFVFSAKDKAGNEGTVITEGNVFLVDSTKPSKVPVVSASVSLNKLILLRWYYENEDEVDYYKVYRSREPGVNFLDFYTNAYKTDFTDYSIEAGEYYYKISVVDDAGNEGELSEEVIAEIKKPETTPATDSKSINVELLPLIDAPINEVKEILYDIEKIRLEFGDSELDELINAEVNLNSQKSIIESYLTQLEGFKTQDMTKEALENEIDLISLKIRSEKKKIPKEISLVEENSYTNQPTNDDLNSAISGLLNVLRIQIDTKNYIDSNHVIQEQYTFTNEAKKIKLTFYDGSSKEYISIQKSVVGDKSIDGYVVEMITKDLAKSVNDITFKNSNHEIIEKDPVIMWKLSDFADRDIQYFVESENSLNVVNDVKTIILKNPDTFEEKEVQNKVTGSFIKIMDNPPNFSTWGLIFGMFIVIGLTMYYFFMDKDISLTGLKGLTKIKNFKSIKAKKIKGKSIKKSVVIDDNVLSSYVTNDDIPPEKYFHLSNGKILRNVKELYDELLFIDMNSFEHHVNNHKNDFSEWVRSSLGLIELSQQLDAIKTKHEMRTILLDHIISKRIDNE